MGYEEVRSDRGKWLLNKVMLGCLIEWEIQPFLQLQAHAARGRVSSGRIHRFAVEEQQMLLKWANAAHILSVIERELSKGPLKKQDWSFGYRLLMDLLS